MYHLRVFTTILKQELTNSLAMKLFPEARDSPT